MRRRRTKAEQTWFDFYDERRKRYSLLPVAVQPKPPQRPALALACLRIDKLSDNLVPELLRKMDAFRGYCTAEIINGFLDELDPDSGTTVEQNAGTI